MKNQSTQNNILNIKFLKIYRKTDINSSADSFSQTSKYKSCYDDEIYSLSQILKKISKNRRFLQDKVFEIKIED